MNRLPAWLFFALLLTSCASTARFTGDFAEYRRYRQARLATTVEARLGESERYLREFPHGHYYEQVRSFYVPAEERYFRLAWNTLPRLRSYLSEMPHGPHAEAVADRITELESRRVFAERREQRAALRTERIELGLAQAAAQRRDFLREFALLVRLLGSTRSFGQPTSELDSELLLRFRVRAPSGRCDAERCTKTFSFTYAVPQNKVLTERRSDVTLEIGLERGMVQSLSLSGPELLTRVAEAVIVRAVPAENPQARAEALGYALDVIAEALDSALPKERCDVEAVSPIVLARRCDGLRAEVVAGTEALAPDRFVVRVERH